ncbi:hypothetical protein MAR_031109 [Mya arenaria]|uniref:DUF4806 domain-containing protein n=1 Tax=Mya arenaria TaxID=6604 RepID=A0ABY7F2X3_MYAAR|nr:hypothetical protein MAR_031109 [Mya arenaria]
MIRLLYLQFNVFSVYVPSRFANGNSTMIPETHVRKNVQKLPVPPRPCPSGLRTEVGVNATSSIPGVMASPTTKPIDIERNTVNENDFQRHVRMKLKKFEENQREILAILSGLNHGVDATPRLSSCNEINMIKPAETEEEFEEINEKLAQNPEIATQMSLFLAVLGGKNLATQTRNIMRSIATNKVWSRFSLKGRGKNTKAALNALPIWKLIMTALLNGKENPSQEQVEEQTKPGYNQCLKNE